MMFQYVPHPGSLQHIWWFFPLETHGFSTEQLQQLRCSAPAAPFLHGRRRSKGTVASSSVPGHGSNRWGKGSSKSSRKIQNTKILYCISIYCMKIHSYCIKMWLIYVCVCVCGVHSVGGINVWRGHLGSLGIFERSGSVTFPGVE